MWAVLNNIEGNFANIPSWFSSILFLIAIVNLLGYLLAWPLMFCWSSAVFWVVCPTLYAFANSVRPFTPATATDHRAALAGLVLLFIGSAASFGCAPTEGANLHIGVDIVVLSVVAVLYFVGGVIIGNVGAVNDCSALFIILFIFAYALIIGSKSLIYSTLILSTIMWCNFLPFSFPGFTSKQRAGYGIAWIGLTITVLYCIFIISIKRREDDMFDSHSHEEKHEGDHAEEQKDKEEPKKESAKQDADP